MSLEGSEIDGEIDNLRASSVDPGIIGFQGIIKR